MNSRQKKYTFFAIGLLFGLALVIIPLNTQAASFDIPCKPSEKGIADLFSCVNQLYKYALVISSIAAIIMIMIGGYMYIFSGGSEKKVGTAKSFIQSSLVGIAVMLVGFVLLGQINPNLLTIKNITPQQVAFTNWDLSNEAYQGAWGGSTPGTTYTNGGKPVAKGQWKDLVNKIAQETNLDPCILQALLDKESSGGIPDSIGHDSHNKSSDPFNPNSPPFYGLNWQYSHGIGMVQITIFKPSLYGGWKDANTPSRKLVGAWHTIPQLLDPEYNLRVGAQYMTQLLKSQKGDLEAAFGGYNGAGKGSGYSRTVMGYYNACKASQGN